MTTLQTAPQTIDTYIASFPPDVQKILRKVRRTIRSAAPQAEEALKYQMPAFILNGNLVYFAGYKRHVGVYPVPAGDEIFRKKIEPYRSAKSSARFPLDQPIPFDLIGQLVKFRIKENQARAAARQSGRLHRRRSPQDDGSDMPAAKKNLRTCPQGHRYNKSSDCPTCPICEQARQSASGFLSELSAPARRALEGAGITTLQQLSQHSEKDILALHGIGPSSMPKLRQALKAEKLAFRPH